MIFLNVHVNCFIIMSGYLGYNKELSCSKWLKLWAQVFFWSMLLFVAVSAITGNSIQPKELVNSLMPFTQQRYWFMTTYLLMYILTPLLNVATRAMNQKQHCRFLVLYFVVFVMLQNVIAWREFTAVNSLSPLFFCFLYMIGAYFHKYPTERKTPWFFIYVVSCLLRIIYFFGISAVTVRLLGEPTGETLLNGYCSFLTVIGAIALFMTFATMKNQYCERTSKAFAFLSPLTLGVYLIHDNASVRAPLWNVLNLTRFINDWYLIPLLVITAVGIFVVCMGMEWLRKKLFKICKVYKIASRVGNKVDVFLEKLCSTNL